LPEGVYRIGVSTWEKEEFASLSFVERRRVIMRNVWKCAWGLVMGLGVLAGNAARSF